MLQNRHGSPLKPRPTDSDEFVKTGVDPPPFALFWKLSGNFPPKNAPRESFGSKMTFSWGVSRNPLMSNNFPWGVSRNPLMSNFFSWGVSHLKSTPDFPLSVGRLLASDSVQRESAVYIYGEQIGLLVEILTNVLLRMVSGDDG